jgi:hypothetical protein
MAFPSPRASAFVLAEHDGFVKEGEERLEAIG